jgi:membrane protein
MVGSVGRRWVELMGNRKFDLDQIFEKFRVLQILKNTMASFAEAKASMAAAGIAYYAFFSLFPLLLLLTAAGSFVLEREQVYQSVIEFLNQAVPTAGDLISENIWFVLQLRGTISVIGFVTLAWSASGAANAVIVNINRAWRDVSERSFVSRRLLALALVGSLVGLLLVWLVTRILLRQVLGLVGAGETTRLASFWYGLTLVFTWLIQYGIFTMLYRWLPNTRVPWKSVLLSALVVALMWEGAFRFFSWFLSSSLNRSALVYGSLSTVAALMLAFYVAGWIILFGAHLCANLQIEMLKED